MACTPSRSAFRARYARPAEVARPADLPGRASEARRLPRRPTSGRASKWPTSGPSRRPSIGVARCSGVERRGGSVERRAVLALKFLLRERLSRSYPLRDTSSAAFPRTSRGIRRPTHQRADLHGRHTPRFTSSTARPVRSYYRTAAPGRHCAHTHAEGVPAFTSCASQPRLLSAGLP